MTDDTTQVRSRLIRYREAAAKDEAVAAKANDPTMRDAYLVMARTWSEMAEQTERELAARRGGR